ncbi:MAG: EamA family transporter [Pirellulaceae bacterium]
MSRCGEDLLLVVLAVCGVSVILADQLRGEDPIAIILGIVSGITYAGVVLSSLRFLRNEDPAWLATFNHVVTAIVFLPAALTASSMPHGRQWFILAAFGAFQMGIPYVLFSPGAAADHWEPGGGAGVARTIARADLECIRAPWLGRESPR